MLSIWNGIKFVSVAVWNGIKNSVMTIIRVWLALKNSEFYVLSLVLYGMASKPFQS
ncbi:hypothetical protein CoNPh26_CDS0141 [Staphylococcus phage S-CoN_Ph26]|nr:hypothetical protein CoNPh26_CDS0141 [Staphylococcus phage S-CoN_Ph26]